MGMSLLVSWLRERSWAERIALLFAANLLLIASAQVRIPLPFTPVPITGQTLGVLLTGALLGSRYGTAVVAAYLFQGAIGLPVFASGQGGLFALLGPTGGYLIGFLPAAFLTGWLLERGWSKHIVLTFTALLIANAVIYALGLPWLSFFVGWERVVPLGLLPFIFGDLLKIAVATGITTKLWCR